MNHAEKYERFKNLRVGRTIALEGLRMKFDCIRDGSFLEPCILDFNQGRIFSPDEFFNNSGPTNLNWEDIAAFSIYSGDENVFYRNMGQGYSNGFNGFFASLLDKLVLDGKMRKDEFLTPSAGDYLIDGRGIYVERSPIEGDSMGNPMVNAYYPRIEIDAVEYAKAFNFGFVTISRTVGHIPCQVANSF
ncbi:MAG: hypothetical protein WC402_03875 [Candidatus Pacearchaeota archaeon]|jgi:hypothetical protein